MPKLTIDGKEIEVPAGTTIIQAADKIGIPIPRYCYHPALPVAGNCRICMVEVEKQPKMQIACNTVVTEGMVVRTNSPKAVEAHQIVLGFLLANHPLDCPVCDQAGECKLQDYYMDYGQYDSRLVDVKVKKTKKAFSIGPQIMLDQERCVLCTRCVRFTDNITHSHELGVFNRGDHSELDVYPGMQVENNYAGNVVDICPVGALTDKDFRFKCRVWYLEKTKSVCPGCSMGCNITVEWDKSRPHQVKKARVMRLKPRFNPDVNQYWMSDEGRYNYNFIDQQRILSPQLNGVVTSWEQAFAAVSGAIKAVTDRSRIGVLASAQLTNEDLFALGQFFKGAQIGFKVPQAPGKSDNFLLKADKNPNTAGAQAILGDGLDSAQIIQKAKQGEFDVLYVFGHDLVKLFGKDTVDQIAKKVKMFVLQASNINDTCMYAHVVLPSAVYAEKDGTFTNCQHRVQRILPAFPPIGEAKGDWTIMKSLAQLSGVDLQCRNSEDVFKAIAATVSDFAGMSYADIGDQGMLLKNKRTNLDLVEQGASK